LAVEGWSAFDCVKWILINIIVIPWDFRSGTGPLRLGETTGAYAARSGRSVWTAMLSATAFATGWKAGDAARVFLDAGLVVGESCVDLRAERARRLDVDRAPRSSGARTTRSRAATQCRSSASIRSSSLVDGVRHGLFARNQPRTS